MGLAFHRVEEATYRQLEGLIALHEADILGPCARGYWFEMPSGYPFEQVQTVARELDSTARLAAAESLELSENEAHGLSMLGLEALVLDREAGEMAPRLLMASVAPAELSAHMATIKRQLGDDLVRLVRQIRPERSDARTRGYVRAQVRYLQQAFPRVWTFHQRALQAGQAVITVDLRARDLFIPDAVELEALYA